MSLYNNNTSLHVCESYCSVTDCGKEKVDLLPSCQNFCKTRKMLSIALWIYLTELLMESDWKDAMLAVMSR